MGFLIDLILNQPLAIADVLVAWHVCRFKSYLGESTIWKLKLKKKKKIHPRLNSEQRVVDFRVSQKSGFSFLAVEGDSVGKNENRYYLISYRWSKWA